MEPWSDWINVLIRGDEQIARAQLRFLPANPQPIWGSASSDLHSTCHKFKEGLGHFHSLAHNQAPRLRQSYLFIGSDTVHWCPREGTQDLSTCCMTNDPLDCPATWELPSLFRRGKWKLAEINILMEGHTFLVYWKLGLHPDLSDSRIRALSTATWTL